MSQFLCVDPGILILAFHQFMNQIVQRHYCTDTFVLISPAGTPASLEATSPFYLFLWETLDLNLYITHVCRIVCIGTSIDILDTHYNNTTLTLWCSHRVVTLSSI